MKNAYMQPLWQPPFPLGVFDAPDVRFGDRSRSSCGGARSIAARVYRAQEGYFTLMIAL